MGAHVTLTAVLLISSTATFIGASVGSDRKKEHIRINIKLNSLFNWGELRCITLQEDVRKRVHKSSRNMEHDKLTVLSRVSNGGFGLRAFSHLINSLHFNVKGREVVHICDD